MTSIKPYPWCPVEFQTRSKELKDSISQQLEACSGKLEIQSSTLGKNCFGMFAKNTIRKREKILDSPRAMDSRTSGSYCYICATSLKFCRISKVDCCPRMKFCARKRKGIANAHYHNVLCGKDFKDIYKRLQE